MLTTHTTPLSSKLGFSALLSLTLALGLTGCDKKPADTPNNAPASTASTTSNTTATANSTATNTATTMAIGSDMTFPPFEYIENNEPKGFDIELMNAILKQSNMTANFVDTRFSNLIPGLDGKKFDALISGMYVTPERQKKVDMIPYFKTHEALIALADSSYQPKTRDELCGKIVAVQKGTLYPTQIQQISKDNCEAKGKPSITIKEFDTSPQAIQALLSKAADVEYDDINTSKSAAEKLKGKVVLSSTDTFFPLLGGMSVRKGDKENYTKITEGLAKIKTSGEYDSLLKKYNLQAPTDEEIKQAVSGQ